MRLLSFRHITSSKVDANEVLPGLYIGGETSLSHITELNPMPVIAVSAAMEVDPNRLVTTSLQSIKHLPLDDINIDWNTNQETLQSVIAFARYIAESWAKGKPILIVCHAGINRSALLVGLALRFLGFSGRDAIQMLKERRGMTLMNGSFRKLVESFNPPNIVK